MPKIKIYAELTAEHPWLDDLLRTSPHDAALIIYQMGSCDGMWESLDRLALK